MFLSHTPFSGANNKQEFFPWTFGYWGVEKTVERGIPSENGTLVTSLQLPKTDGGRIWEKGDVPIANGICFE